MDTAAKCRLILSVLVASFGTSFQWYNKSVIDEIDEVIKSWMNETFQLHYNEALTEELYTWLWPLAAAGKQISLSC